MSLSSLSAGGKSLEQRVVNGAGVGLDVAGVAFEHLADGGARVLGLVLEEDVIAVGEDDEEVPFAAGLGLVARHSAGLDRDAVASVERQKHFANASSRAASVTCDQLRDPMALGLRGPQEPSPHFFLHPSMWVVLDASPTFE